jgi:hypothetical protein
MVLDLGTMIAIIIALSTSCFVMVLSILENTRLRKIIKQLTK